MKSIDQDIYSFDDVEKEKEQLYNQISSYKNSIINDLKNGMGQNIMEEIANKSNKSNTNKKSRFSILKRILKSI